MCYVRKITLHLTLCVFLDTLCVRYLMCYFLDCWYSKEYCTKQPIVRMRNNYAHYYRHVHILIRRRWRWHIRCDCIRRRISVLRWYRCRVCARVTRSSATDCVRWCQQGQWCRLSVCQWVKSSIDVVSTTTTRQSGGLSAADDDDD